MFADFKKRGVAVLGVSIDDQKSHKKFAEKHELPYQLLVDTDHQIVEAYGAWGEKTNYGKKYMGTFRITYVIDGAGNVAAAYPKVKPEEHAAEILTFVKAN